MNKGEKNCSNIYKRLQRLIVNFLDGEQNKDIREYKYKKNNYLKKLLLFSLLMLLNFVNIYLLLVTQYDLLSLIEDYKNNTSNFTNKSRSTYNISDSKKYKYKRFIRDIYNCSKNLHSNNISRIINSSKQNNSPYFLLDDMRLNKSIGFKKASDFLNFIIAEKISNASDTLRVNYSQMRNIPYFINKNNRPYNKTFSSRYLVSKSSEQEYESSLLNIQLNNTLIVLEKNYKKIFPISYLMLVYSAMKIIIFLSLYLYREFLDAQSLRKVFTFAKDGKNAFDNIEKSLSKNKAISKHAAKDLISQSRIYKEKTAQDYSSQSSIEQPNLNFFYYNNFNNFENFNNLSGLDFSKNNKPLSNSNSYGVNENSIKSSQITGTKTFKRIKTLLDDILSFFIAIDLILQFFVLALETNISYTSKIYSFSNTSKSIDNTANKSNLFFIQHYFLLFFLNVLNSMLISYKRKLAFSGRLIAFVLIQIFAIFPEEDLLLSILGLIAFILEIYFLDLKFLNFKIQIYFSNKKYKNQLLSYKNLFNNIKIGISFFDERMNCQFNKSFKAIIELFRVHGKLLIEPAHFCYNNSRYDNCLVVNKAEKQTRQNIFKSFENVNKHRKAHQPREAVEAEYSRKNSFINNIKNSLISSFDEKEKLKNSESKTLRNAQTPNANISFPFENAEKNSQVLGYQRHLNRNLGNNPANEIVNFQLLKTKQKDSIEHLKHLGLEYQAAKAVESFIMLFYNLKEEKKFFTRLGSSGTEAYEKFKFAIKSYIDYNDQCKKGTFRQDKSPKKPLSPLYLFKKFSDDNNININNENYPNNINTHQQKEKVKLNNNNNYSNNNKRMSSNINITKLEVIENSNTESINNTSSISSIHSNNRIESLFPEANAQVNNSGMNKVSICQNKDILNKKVNKEKDNLHSNNASIRSDDEINTSNYNLKSKPQKPCNATTVEQCQLAEIIFEEAKNFYKALFHNCKSNDFLLIGSKHIPAAGQYERESQNEEKINADRNFEIYLNKNKTNKNLEFVIQEQKEKCKFVTNADNSQNKIKNIFLKKFSHEFRNPLLNITQLCDNILADFNSHLGNQNINNNNNNNPKSADDMQNFNNDIYYHTKNVNSNSLKSINSTLFQRNYQIGNDSPSFSALHSNINSCSNFLQLANNFNYNKMYNYTNNNYFYANTNKNNLENNNNNNNYISNQNNYMRKHSSLYKLSELLSRFNNNENLTQIHTGKTFHIQNDFNIMNGYQNVILTDYENLQNIKNLCYFMLYILTDFEALGKIDFDQLSKACARDFNNNCYKSCFSANNNINFNNQNSFGTHRTVTEGNKSHLVNNKNSEQESNEKASSNKHNQNTLNNVNLNTKKVVPPRLSLNSKSEAKVIKAAENFDSNNKNKYNTKALKDCYISDTPNQDKKHKKSEWVFLDSSINNFYNNNNLNNFNTSSNKVLNNNNIVKKNNKANETFFYIEKIFRKLIKIFNTKISLAGKQLLIKYEITNNFPKQIKFDLKKLNQILFNLLSNSIKFTNIGSIVVTADYSEEIIAFKVKDTGIGIKKEFLERIGTPFFNTQSNNNYYGMGMGIYLVKHYTELLNGDFKLESELGKGTCISISFPYDVEDNKKKIENSMINLEKKFAIFKTQDEKSYIQKNKLSSNSNLLLGNKGLTSKVNSIRNSNTNIIINNNNFFPLSDSSKSLSPIIMKKTNQNFGQIHTSRNSSVHNLKNITMIRDLGGLNKTLKNHHHHSATKNNFNKSEINKDLKNNLFCIFNPSSYKEKANYKENNNFMPYSNGNFNENKSNNNLIHANNNNNINNIIDGEIKLRNQKSVNNMPLKKLNSISTLEPIFESQKNAFEAKQMHVNNKKNAQKNHKSSPHTNTKIPTTNNRIFFVSSFTKNLKEGENIKPSQTLNENKRKNNQSPKGQATCISEPEDERATIAVETPNEFTIINEQIDLKFDYNTLKGNQKSDADFSRLSLRPEEEKDNIRFKINASKSINKIICNSSDSNLFDIDNYNDSSMDEKEIYYDIVISKPKTETRITRNASHISQCRQNKKKPNKLRLSVVDDEGVKKTIVNNNFLPRNLFSLKDLNYFTDDSIKAHERNNWNDDKNNFEKYHQNKRSDSRGRESLHQRLYDSEEKTNSFQYENGDNYNNYNENNKSRINKQSRNTHTSYLHSSDNQNKLRFSTLNKGSYYRSSIINKDSCLLDNLNKSFRKEFLINENSSCNWDNLKVDKLCFSIHPNKEDYLNQIICSSKQNSEYNIFRILVVDDEKLIRQSEINIIKKFFVRKKLEFKVEECSDGIECIYKIYQSLNKGIKYDLILTDETMNFLKGSTMAKIIKSLVKENVIKDIKIFMITSYESDNIYLKFSEALERVFTKPLTLNIFETIINLC